MIIKHKFSAKRLARKMSGLSRRQWRKIPAVYRAERADTAQIVINSRIYGSLR